MGPRVARLLRELLLPVDEGLVDKGKVLDSFYVPNGHLEGPPFEHYGRCTRKRFAMPVRSLSSSVLVWPDRDTV